MKWFLVAIMTVVYNGDEKDVYIWSDPHFESSAQCLEFAQQNRTRVNSHLQDQFPGDSVSRLLCVEEEKLRQFLTDAHTEQGESI